LDVAVEMIAPAGAHPVQPGKVEDGLSAAQRLAHVGVVQLELFEHEVAVLECDLEVPLLKRTLVEVAERIDPHDLVPVREQPLAEVGANETGGAGYHHSHVTNLTFSDVKRFESWLSSTDYGAKVKSFPDGTRTATDAARAVGCELGQIVKSLVFVAGGRPVVALVSGSNRLDEERLASVAGTPVVKADAVMARSSTGYSIGGVPPFGHLTDIPVFMDRDLLGYDVVWAAAGRPDSVFEIEPERLRELSNATVIDLRKG